jgi:hypothetical protein
VDPSDAATRRPILSPTDEADVFIVDAGVREAGERAVFNRTPEGRVASVYVAGDTWLRLDPVT